MFTHETVTTTTPVLPPEIEAALRLLEINAKDAGMVPIQEAKHAALLLLARYFAARTEPEAKP